MGQVVRQQKYNKVWEHITDTWESARRVIELALQLLPDEQLDELLKELEKRS